MTWTIPALTGALVGLGLYLLVRNLVPAAPRPEAAIARLTGADRPTPLSADDDPSMPAKVGRWVQRRVPPADLAKLLPTKTDLDLVGKTSQEVLGTKILCALMGLAVGPILLLLATIGLPVPSTIPIGLSLVFAIGFFFVPDLEVKSKAKAARAEFARAVSAYLELIAIDRISGAGATQATEGAAKVAHSWPFQRIRGALDRARLGGKSAWAGLDELADETGVDELHDVAQIMRLAGSEDSSVYEQLRAKARSLRSTQLAREQQQAAEESNRMTFPVTATAFVFVLMLLYPMLSSALAV